MCIRALHVSLHNAIAGQGCWLTGSRCVGRMLKPANDPRRGFHCSTWRKPLTRSLRKECAANRRLVSVQGWNPTPPETTYYDITAANAYATLDGSLSNDSADTSPGNASLIDQPSASLGTGPLLNPTIYAVPAPGTVYPVYAPHVGPPPLYNQAPGAEFEHAAPVGRYVLQPDGSQVYIPYG